MRNMYPVISRDDVCVFEGRYEKRFFEIYTQHIGFPCAGISFPEGRYVKHVEDIPVDVHGGFTTIYEKDGVPMIGFDYGHVGDYHAHSPEEDGTRYDLMAIIKEIIRVIDALNAVYR
ncbi:hypothetical protein J5500_03050 [Candidatus Saccharibacteria bacterium]|nr:hypothetical protein [Candidatus Saccharibacteria bacterium]